MKKLILTLTAVACAAGLIAFPGCGGVKEDPDAANNEAGEENLTDEDPEQELGTKGEKQHKSGIKKGGNPDSGGE